MSFPTKLFSMSATLPLAMLAPIAEADVYRDRFKKWLGVLKDGALFKGSEGEQDGQNGSWYVPELDACLNLRRRDYSALPPDEFEVARFRLGSVAHEPWLVQINIPNLETGQGDTRLAEEGSDPKRIWLMRRGRLQQNGATPAIPDVEFRSKRSPDIVLSNGQAWYKVAMLDGTPQEILEQTRRFLHLCHLIRQVYISQATEDGHPGASVHEPNEPVTSYKVPGQAEKLVEQRQGKVLKRLVERLRGAGIWPVTLRSQGFACDLLIQAEPKEILIEIKTDTLASDIYMGVGQLMLYPGLLDLKAPLRRVLLLPDSSRSDMVDVARAENIEVGFYRLKGQWSDEELDVEFLHDICDICNIPVMA